MSDTAAGDTLASDTAQSGAAASDTSASERGSRSARARIARALGGVAAGARLERMRRSQHYAGRKFANTHATGLMQANKLWSVMQASWRSRATQRPPAPLPIAADTRARLATPARSSLRMTWLGHSTMLIELDGTRLVTDPVFGKRASPSASVGPLRFHAPPVEVPDLAPVDAFLISHDHYDHLDLPTIAAIARDPRFSSARFITALGVGAHLEAWGIEPARIEELDWWDETRVGSLRISAAPAQHFSGRGAGDRDATLWMSLFVRGSASVFFSGDTGWSPHFSLIRERLGRPDVAMLEIGAFHPAWGDIHLGPENASRAFSDLGAEVLLPVHWGTFALGAHPWDEPGEQLFVGAKRDGLPLLTPLIGEPFEPARNPATGPWWRDVKAPR